jgi:hypothetical protein
MSKRNLTQEISKKFKKKYDPIQRELQEQYEMIQNHRSLSRFSFQFETIKKSKIC